MVLLVSSLRVLPAVEWIRINVAILGLAKFELMELCVELQLGLVISLRPATVELLIAHLILSLQLAQPAKLLHHLCTLAAATERSATLTLISVPSCLPTTVLSLLQSLAPALRFPQTSPPLITMLPAVALFGVSELLMVTAFGG